MTCIRVESQRKNTLTTNLGTRFLRWLRISVFFLIPLPPALTWIFRNIIQILRRTLQIICGYCVMNHQIFRTRIKSQKWRVVNKNNSRVEVSCIIVFQVAFLSCSLVLSNVLFLYTCSCHRLIFQTLTSLEFLDKVSCNLL